MAFLLHLGDVRDRDGGKLLQMGVYLFQNALSVQPEVRVQRLPRALAILGGQKIPRIAVVGAPGRFRTLLAVVAQAVPVHGGLQGAGPLQYGAVRGHCVDAHAPPGLESHQATTERELSSSTAPQPSRRVVHVGAGRESTRGRGGAGLLVEEVCRGSLWLLGRLQAGVESHVVQGDDVHLLLQRRDGEDGGQVGGPLHVVVEVAAHADFLERLARVGVPAHGEVILTTREQKARVVRTPAERPDSLGVPLEGTGVVRHLLTEIPELDHRMAVRLRRRSQHRRLGGVPGDAPAPVLDFRPLLWQRGDHPLCSEVPDASRTVRRGQGQDALHLAVPCDGGEAVATGGGNGGSLLLQIPNEQLVIRA
mmetsp:Transcript_26832/g.75005  ORF Transcript_26832/g.75005 Transcript_26832/m.75005 type:complete len:364 (-) Transcript_26832:513-1604(-)